MLTRVFLSQWSNRSPSINQATNLARETPSIRPHEVRCINAKSPGLARLWFLSIEYPGNPDPSFAHCTAVPPKVYHTTEPSLPVGRPVPLCRTPSSPLLCGSVPSEFPGDRDWGGGRSSAAAPDYDEGGGGYGDDEDDGDDDEEEEEGVSRGAWGDDALVSGDPAAIEAAWGHAVDFVVDAGLLEVKKLSIRWSAWKESFVYHSSIGCCLLLRRACWFSVCSCSALPKKYGPYAERDR